MKVSALVNADTCDSQCRYLRWPMNQIATGIFCKHRGTEAQSFLFLNTKTRRNKVLLQYWKIQRAAKLLFTKDTKLISAASGSVGVRIRLRLKGTP